MSLGAYLQTLSCGDGENFQKRLQNFVHVYFNMVLNLWRDGITYVSPKVACQYNAVGLDRHWRDNTQLSFKSTFAVLRMLENQTEYKEELTSYDASSVCHTVTKGI